MDGKIIEIEGKLFQKYISKESLRDIVQSLADSINTDYKDKDNLVLIVVLNGAFMFASDLFKQINGLVKISFVKLSSYENDTSTGVVKNLIGLNEDLTGKDVLITEDIVDSGQSMAYMLKQIKALNPKSLEICTLMFKPDNFKGNYNVKYIGKEISNEFIIGYGFDINGLGRNLPDIYQLKN